MYAYDTITEAVADLKKRGYTLDFNIRDNRLACDQLENHFGHEELRRSTDLKVPATRPMKQWCMLLKRHQEHWAFW